MDDQEFRDERSRFLREMAEDMSEERSRMVIGRVTQLAAMMIDAGVGVWVDDIPYIPPEHPRIEVQPLYMLYVFRQNGQARMIVNRVDPFQYEQMILTELEMLLVMEWAHKMVVDDIGRFTPADGGWMWWGK